MKVLKFGAVWCPGCLVMRPRWKEIEEQDPLLVTEYFDYDEDRRACEKYRVDKNLPVFIFLNKNGKELERISGEVATKDLLALIEKYKDA